MQARDSMWEYVTYTPASSDPAASSIPTAVVLREADSILADLGDARSPDPELSPRREQLEARLLAIVARARLLSGGVPSVEEARALTEVELQVEPKPDAQALAAPVAQASPVDSAMPTFPAPRPGVLVIPVAGVKRTDLMDTFSQSRDAGRVHNAIDIMAPRGTPVVAAADGSVLKLFQSVRGGTTIYTLAADRRTVMYYAHLDRYAPAMREGLDVAAGTVIGYVGDTGNAGKGNFHLHFAMWVTDDPRRYWDGATINPFPLLQRADTVRRDAASSGER